MARRPKALERQLEELWKRPAGDGGNAQGPKGDKGDKGDPGATGPAGPMGPAGAAGQPGSPGIAGEKGETGETGPAGPKGDPGDFGPVGETGPIGLTGPKGDKGDRGEKGETGDTGPQGLPGVGAAGPTGPKGDKGDTGDVGAAGSAGATGLSAFQVAVANGFAGTEAQWLLSLKGAKGDAGVKGDTGNVGPAGPAGSFPSQTASLGADVQIPGNNTFVDGPSVTLDAGTWLVTGAVTFQRNATTAVHWIARLSTGTVHYASGQTYQPSLSGHTAQIGLSAIVTLVAQTAVKLQGAISAGSTTSLMKAATPAAGSGNNATRINAVKIA